MKKLFYFSMAAVLLLTACDKKGQNDKLSTTLESMELSGKVKRIVESDNRRTNPEWFDYDVEDLKDVEIERWVFEHQEEGDMFYHPLLEGEIEEESLPAISEWQFNENGMGIQQTSYNDFDEPWVDKWVYGYDDKNRQTNNEHYNSTGAMESYYRSAFDEKGRMISGESWWTGTEVTTMEYAYGENGEWSEEWIHNGERLTWHERTEYEEDRTTRRDIYSCSNNTIFSSYTYEYGKFGENYQTLRQDYYYEGELRSQILYNYDSKGNMKDQACVNADGDTTSYYYYEQDEQGREIFQAGFFEGSEVADYTITQKYDSHGNSIFYEYKSNEYNNKTTSRYDSKDRLVDEVDYDSMTGLETHKVTIYNEAGKISEIRTFKSLHSNYANGQYADEQLMSREVYTYDANGNWVRREDYYTQKSGEEVLASVATREIEYY